jgi:hypothetical protein
MIVHLGYYITKTEKMDFLRKLRYNKIKMKKKIAIQIQSEVQFFSIAPVLEELKKIPYNFTVIVNDCNWDKNGYKEMIKALITFIENRGYKIKTVTECKNDIFDLCLAPYMFRDIKAKCYLKYEYGTLNVKPNLTYIPEVLEGFHGFLCQSTVTADLLAVYGKTFLVDNLRFYSKDKKKRSEREKKVVLFAPTYNDKEEIEELVQMVEKMKEKYWVVIKGHHGTEYLKNNSKQKDALVSVADEYFGSETNLADLLMSADVFLSGNSSSIAEAIYAEIPCLIFAKELDYFKLEDIHTTQFELVRDGLISYCDSVSEINEKIAEALSDDMINKQKKLADRFFPQRASGTKAYMETIRYFLEDETAQDYVKLHDFIMNDRQGKLDGCIKKIEDINNKYNACLMELAAKNSILEDNQKKKLYKVADKIYKAKNKVFNGIQKRI